MFADSFDFGLTNRYQKVMANLLSSEIKAVSVHHLIFQKHDGVVISDGCLQESSSIGGRIRGQSGKSGDRPVPSGEALRMLSTNGGRGSVGASEHYGTAKVAARHVV